MIKRLLLITMLFVTACSNNNNNTDPDPDPRLTSSEGLLIAELGFDKEVFKILKQATNNEIHQFTGYDENNKPNKAEGIVSPTEHGVETLKILRKKLKGKDYIVFLESSQSIGIIKGRDQTKIIQIMGTEGPNYDVLNEDIIKFFKDWERKYNFNILYADDSAVNIELNELPTDFVLFANEIYKICPDTVDSGSGSIEGLIEEIKMTNGVAFWWD
ncbi:DUF4253 domain-containing protein [Paenibacillus sp. 19GGS1-52]|uniref:DUF4253 domain-containing protein n=1 Tax=Paenibacillus sp. 19GGS1-52 TaxID=2758563 RepID=UPI001EFA8612|nr:DUF4253 domain-containing protein [Paenibacillus sp. 19GGS1-52]ULO08550.1 DUF4253 domain-containing protein [Paenibacillus sp. 19GGS1-52]